MGSSSDHHGIPEFVQGSKRTLTSYRFQCCIASQRGKIGARVALGEQRQALQVGVAERTALLLQQPAEEQLARILVRQGHVDALRKAPKGRLVELLGSVGGGHDDYLVGFRVGRPSNCTRNSVFSRRVASCSLLLRSDSTESTSSMKMIDGCSSRATAKSARTSFSPSPTYLLVSDAADMLKKVAEHSVATARASSVLPLPGGPNSSSPLAGVRSPALGSLPHLSAASPTLDGDAPLQLQDALPVEFNGQLFLIYKFKGT
uniref:Uncharacterized protein n=1 Tax=Anopheles atroparvus TaxID=41427 RepID=A0A182IV30_ANOAO